MLERPFCVKDLIARLQGLPPHAIVAVTTDERAPKTLHAVEDLQLVDTEFHPLTLVIVGNHD